MRIRWCRSVDGYVNSYDGRFRIAPLFCGCTRPQAFSLRDRGVEVSGFLATQREAKTEAQAIVEREPTP